MRSTHRNFYDLILYRVHGRYRILDVEVVGSGTGGKGGRGRHGRGTGEGSHRDSRAGTGGVVPSREIGGQEGEGK